MFRILTSLNKILSIKTLLIFLSIITFLEIYFLIELKVPFLNNYQLLLDEKLILELVLLYTLSIVVAVPITAIMVVLIISMITLNNQKKNDIPFLFMDEEYSSLLQMKEKAIEENNFSLMISYQEKVISYKDKQGVYQYSFFLVLLILYALMNQISFESLYIYNVFVFFEYFNSDQRDILYYAYIFITSLMFIIFAVRYLVSYEFRLNNWFNIDNWGNKI